MDSVSKKYFNTIFPNEIIIIIDIILKKTEYIRLLFKRYEGTIKLEKKKNLCNLCLSPGCLRHEYVDGIGYVCDICRFGL